MRPLSPNTADDEHRIVLEPLEGFTDCQHDFMNASYIDVRARKLAVLGCLAAVGLIVQEEAAWESNSYMCV